MVRYVWWEGYAVHYTRNKIGSVQLSVVIRVVLISVGIGLAGGFVWRAVASGVMQQHPVGSATAAVGIAVTVIVLVLWRLPKWHVAKLTISEDKDRAELENELRKTLAQIIGGVAFFTGLYFSWESLHVTQEGQITDRFSRAIEQLGNKHKEVRMGGIIALGRIARDSPLDHWPIMEILTAYVRQNAPWGELPTEQNPATEKNAIQLRPKEDIQMALRVLSQRSRTYGKGEERHLNLNATDLRGADLWEAHFEGAHFWGTNLEQAELWSSHLQGAYFVRAHLSRVRLDGANLSDSHLEEAELWEAQLFQARLDRAHLWGAKLGWAWLQDAHFEKACLRGASLQGAYPLRARFDGAVLEGADLREITPDYLQQEQIETTCMDDKTILPPHLKRAPACPPELTEKICTDK